MASASQVISSVCRHQAAAGFLLLDILLMSSACLVHHEAGGCYGMAYNMAGINVVEGMLQLVQGFTKN